MVSERRGQNLVSESGFGAFAPGAAARRDARCILQVPAVRRPRRAAADDDIYKAAACAADIWIVIGGSDYIV